MRFLVSLLFATSLSGLAAADYDVLIVGGLVYDGTGAPPRQAAVGIKGDKIALVGEAGTSTATRTIDVKGKAVAPGFMDMHAHLDTLPRLPAGESAVRQGVTTGLGGPDGNGPWPMADHLQEMERLPLGLNVAFLTGHNTIRLGVLKMADRSPAPSELKQMQEMVAQAMREGAFGLSTGLKYLPGAFAQTDELIALSAIAGQLGGFYASHLREEGTGLLPAVGEAIEIGRKARIPIVITHHKAVGKPTWGASVKTLALVDAARAQGIDVMMDQYPLPSHSTGTSHHKCLEMNPRHGRLRD